MMPWNWKLQLRTQVIDTGDTIMESHATPINPENNQREKSPIPLSKENPKSFRDAVMKNRNSSQEDVEKRIAEFDFSDEEEDEMESDESSQTTSRIKIVFLHRPHWKIWWHMAAMGSQNRHCQNQPHIQPSYSRHHHQRLL